MTRLAVFLCLLALLPGYLSSDQTSTASSSATEEGVKTKPSTAQFDERSIGERGEEPPHVPCSRVVDGREKCIQIGFKESACGSPVITESDITCPSSSNPTIFILPGNEKERFLPARFMICMAGGRWMISGLDGSFMGDHDMSSPIHVICFPQLPEEEQLDDLDDEEMEEKFGDKKGMEKEKTEL